MAEETPYAELQRQVSAAAVARLAEMLAGTEFEEPLRQNSTRPEQECAKHSLTRREEET